MPGTRDTHSFIRSTFRSAWTLELLCLLRKHRERAWSPAELVAALRASDLIVTQSLASLAAAGLVVVQEDQRVQYQPASDDLDTLAAASEQLYAKSPDSVRRLIITSATGGLSAFADAFKLRRD